ncbi:MAG: hypothetical protein J1E38_02955 [Paramuribaculum sp.]|nr:hypothetical protein [Paramuribaculum sp.]
MTNIRLLSLLLLFIVCGSAYSAENVVLFSENGQGGIKRTTGKLIVYQGQYYVDIPVGRGSERLKVSRISDSARLIYHRKKWAEKYRYVAEKSDGWFYSEPYYFNMTSRWIPSPTEDPSDPYRIVPVKKLWGYHTDFNGGRTPMKLVLIKTQGKYMIYYGDEMFAAEIYPNKSTSANEPAWTRNFKYCCRVSGFDVYFNI